MRAGVPVIFGFVPVGIAFAIAARGAGFSILETQLMSLGVFAGASQMMAAKMYGEAAGIAAIIIATFILNLRHIIMSTCVMNKMREAPVWLRAVGAFGVTDESFAIFSPLDGSLATPAFYFGLITVTYSSWNIGTFLGAVGADFLPEILTLAFGVALYAMFISIITPDMVGNLGLAIVILFTAGLNWALSLIIDESWAMIGATIIGALVGVFTVKLDNGDPVSNKTDENGEKSSGAGVEK